MVAQAQFSSHYDAGSYVLKNQQNERRYGSLKLKNGRKLLIKTETGKKQVLKAKQVLNCTIWSRYFTVVHNVNFTINSITVTESAVFAQTLDSGKVTLLRYDHLLNSGKYPLRINCM